MMMPCCLWQMPGRFRQDHPGALAAGLYSLHCTETGLGFIAAWYGAALLMAAGLGAWLGPRLLRW